MSHEFLVCGGTVAARRAEIEGGSLFAHRAYGTTYAAHSLELKVIAQQASLKLFFFKILYFFVDFVVFG